MTSTRRRRATTSVSSERGASLIIVLVIMMLGGLTVAALMTFAQTTLRASKVYKERTAEVQSASDAVDVALTEIRYVRTRGTEGSASTDVVYGDGTAKCVAEGGSGDPDPEGGFVDRTVYCEGSSGGRLRVTTRVQFIDQNGDEPGGELQVLARTIVT